MWRVEGERMGGKRKVGDGRRQRIFRLAFWNVAGIKNKERDFLDGIKE